MDQLLSYVGYVGGPLWSAIESKNRKRILDVLQQDNWSNGNYIGDFCRLFNLLASFCCSTKDVDLMRIALLHCNDSQYRAMLREQFLTVAIKNHFLDGAKFCGEAGIDFAAPLFSDPSDFGYTALHLACKACVPAERPEKRAVRRGDDWKNWIEEAPVEHSKEIVLYLLKNGALPAIDSETEEYHDTPLYACQDLLPIALVLLAAGASGKGSSFNSEDFVSAIYKTVYSSCYLCGTWNENAQHSTDTCPIYQQRMALCLKRLDKERLDLIRDDVYEICVGLQSLQISTEELRCIVDASLVLAQCCPLFLKMRLICKIRHFR